MVSNPDNSIAGYVKLYSEALPKIREAIQQNATGSKILPDPVPEQNATGSEKVMVAA